MEKLKNNSSALGHVLENIVPLNLKEREKKSLNSISITTNICRYAHGFRIQTRTLVVRGSNQIFQKGKIHEISKKYIEDHSSFKVDRCFVNAREF